MNISYKMISKRRRGQFNVKRLKELEMLLGTNDMLVFLHILFIFIICRTPASLSFSCQSGPFFNGFFGQCRPCDAFSFSLFNFFLPFLHFISINSIIVFYRLSLSQDPNIAYYMQTHSERRQYQLKCRICELERKKTFQVYQRHHQNM